jgi:hypothetical protein
MKAALSNLAYFDLWDVQGGKTVKGGDQEWYGSWFRRMGGCGPTTVSNVVLYLTNAHAAAADATDARGATGAGAEDVPDPAEDVRESARGADPDGNPAPPRAARIRDKQEFIRLMDRMWKYVTPGRGGVNTTQKLRQGVAGYSAQNGLRLRTEALDVADARAERPSLERVVEFIRVGLERDLPVAFLNLDNGLELQLDKWHWVTITGLAYDEAGGAAITEILDNCDRLDVNLGRWLSSAARGGGFVRFLL